MSIAIRYKLWYNLCLVGTTITDIVKSTGVQVANKITINMLEKVAWSSPHLKLTKR